MKLSFVTIFLLAVVLPAALTVLRAGSAPPSGTIANNKGLQSFISTPYNSCNPGDRSTWLRETCPDGMVQTNINAEIAIWRYLRIGWYRLPAYQQGLDPNCDGSIKWGKNGGTGTGIGFDAVIADLQSVGVTPLIMIGGTASCANGGVGNGWFAPSNPATWASEYVAAVATHMLSRGVHNYEIWNEANGNWSWNGNVPNASFYTRMVCDAYSTIHDIDPAANVIATLAGSYGATILDTSFLTAMYAAGVYGCFDSLADHPYSNNGPANNYLRGGSTNDWDRMTGQDSTRPSLVSIMAANRDGSKKIWITELGCSGDAGSNGSKSFVYCGNASTSSPSAGNQQQQQIVDAYSGVGRFPQQGPTFWFQEHDQDASVDPCDSSSDGDPDDNCTGLYSNSFAGKPAAATFAAQSGQW